MKHIIHRKPHHWLHRPFTWEDFDREFNRFFSWPKWEIGDIESSDWLPEIDIKEADDKYTITADVPGINPKDVEIGVEQDVVTIKGERETEEKEEKEKYVRVERSKGSFYRRFVLPNADAEHVSAESKNGVLTIIVPKTEKAEKKRIEVKEIS